MQWQYWRRNGKLAVWWLDFEDGDKYFFDKNSVMTSGKWLRIDGKNYYFYPDGKFAVNTTIDGYKVGEDSAR